MGIEPTPSAWEAEVLPLNYTRGMIPPVFARFNQAGDASILTIKQDRCKIGAPNVREHARRRIIRGYEKPLDPRRSQSPA